MTNKDLRLEYRQTTGTDAVNSDLPFSFDRIAVDNDAGISNGNK